MNDEYKYEDLLNDIEGEIYTIVEEDNYDE